MCVPSSQDCANFLGKKEEQSTFKTSPWTTSSLPSTKSETYCKQL